jgi:hydrogenase maturation protease
MRKRVSTAFYTFVPASFANKVSTLRIMENEKKILVYGFGNPGRMDDGLGNEFSRLTEAWATAQNLTHVVCDSNYQLNVEDALEISAYDVVIFADATIEDEVEDYRFDILDPEKESIKYTLHAASPGYILELCNSLYGKFPTTYLMRIKGYEWDFKEGLTAGALQNLDKAFAHFISQFTKL